MKQYIIWVVILLSGIFIILGIEYIDGCCPRGSRPPTPIRPKPPAPSKPEAPKPEAPKPEAPKPPPPPPPGSQAPGAPERPQPQPQPQPTTPSQPPPAQPSPSGPTAPVAPGGAGGARPPTGGPSSVSRPPLTIGLQPLIQNLQSLVGVVEPWEVWWTRNRDKYLSSRQPIEWAKIIDEGGSRSITLYPIYDELVNALSEGVSDRDQFVAFRAAISLGKVQDSHTATVSSQKAVEVLKKTHETESRFLVRNNILLGLGMTADATVWDIIKEVIREKKDSPALRRSYAILSAGYLPDDNGEISKLLKEIAVDERDDREVKASACLSLGNLKDISAIGLLGKILTGPPGGKREHSQIRAYAALGLGRIGTQEALAELKKCDPKKEKEVDVRSAVVVALGMTGFPPNPESIRGLAEAAKDAIMPYLQDRTSVIKALAAVALAQI
ncbi:MAG: HEAT repeat domain-containing protein, partial [Planctomycetota bacterium]|nr:HEAT repeat domain-containing protein [Planctomycetota bacterium]